MANIDREAITVRHRIDSCAPEPAFAPGRICLDLLHLYCLAVPHRHYYELGYLRPFFDVYG